MNSELDKVRQYYDGDDEENRFCDPRKKIEYINTCKIIAPYIKPGCELLDCAAGTGAYEEYLLTLGCKRIVASDLSPRNVGILSQRCSNYPQVEAFVDNALELSRHSNGSFDVVLCLGPMYHLRPELSEKCLLECMRVLKDHGKLIVAYMPRHFVFWNLLNNPVYNVPFNEVIFLARNGYLPSSRKGFWGCTYFSSPEEMENLANRVKLHVVEHRAVDLELGNFYDKIGNCSQDELKILCDYLYEKSTDKFILGSSEHNIIILEK